jgi:hypothetical protein
MLTAEELEALARARAAIEAAIEVLQVNRQTMTEGQVKEVKRVIYWRTEDDPTP